MKFSPWIFTMILYSHFESLKYRFQKKQTTWVNVSDEITDWVLYFWFLLQSWHENKSQGVTFSSYKSLLWKQNVKSLIFFFFLSNFFYFQMCLENKDKLQKIWPALPTQKLKVQCYSYPRVPRYHTSAYPAEGAKGNLLCNRSWVKLETTFVHLISFPFLELTVLHCMCGSKSLCLGVTG